MAFNMDKPLVELNFQEIPTIEEVEEKIIDGIFDTIKEIHDEETLDNIYSKIKSIIDELHPESDQEIYCETEAELEKKKEHYRKMIGTDQISDLITDTGESQHQCGDLSCPHKSPIPPMLLWGLANGPTGKVVNLEKWEPFKYPIFRAPEKASMNGINYINALILNGTKTNMARLATTKTFKTGKYYPLSYSNSFDFIEAFMFLDKVPSSMDLFYTSRCSKLHIEPLQKYNYVGMIPLYDAGYSKQGIRFYGDEEEYRVDIIGHRCTSIKGLQAFDTHIKFTKPDNIDVELYEDGHDEDREYIYRMMGGMLRLQPCE